MLPREIAGLGNAMDPGQLACAVMKLDRMFRAAEPETSQCEGSTALFAVFRPLRASDPRPSAEVHEFPVDQVLLELLPEEHRRKKRANQQPQQPQVEKQGEALAGSRSNSRRRSISAAMNSPGVGANKEAIKDGTEGDAVGANGPPKPGGLRIRLSASRCGCARQGGFGSLDDVSLLFSNACSFRRRFGHLCYFPTSVGLHSCKCLSRWLAVMDVCEP